jgi:hypothetical protein
MRICNLLCAGAIPALFFASSSAVLAQPFESVGVRAQGLGGAFVAVADDATASWWNPAGLATGAYLSGVVERGQTTEPEDPPAQGPSRRTTPTSVALAFPALAVSYYSLRISETAPPLGSTGVPNPDRQDPGNTGTSVRSVSLRQFGVSFAQSLGKAFVIGTTWKLMRAGAAQALTVSSEPLDVGDDLDVPRSWGLDFDIGVLAKFGHVRLGGTLKNVRSPTFGDAGVLQLPREGRVGLSIYSHKEGGTRGVVVASDFDVLTTTTVFGDVRHAAGGVEAWLAGGRVGLRGGVSANTVGAARPAASVGFSVGTKTVHGNVARTFGQDRSLTGWGASVSFTY